MKLEKVKKFRKMLDGPNELKALQRELEMHLRRYGDAEAFPNMLILKDEAYIESEFKMFDKNVKPKNCKRCKNNLHRGDGTAYCATGDRSCHFESEE